jgi:hypothetical protein
MGKTVDWSDLIGKTLNRIPLRYSNHQAITLYYNNDMDSVDLDLGSNKRRIVNEVIINVRPLECVFCPMRPGAVGPVDKGVIMTNKYCYNFYDRVIHLPDIINVGHSTYKKIGNLWVRE